MEKVILKSMVDFVLWLDMADIRGNGKYDKMVSFAKFLNSPLNLGMFVPAKLVDGVWVVLEEPLKMDYIPFEGRQTKHPIECYESDLKEYQEAKDRVLFEGFETQKDTYHQTERTFL